MSRSAAMPGETAEAALPGESLPARPPGLGHATQYWPEIESLRGIAIILVLLFHVVGFVDGAGGRPGFNVSPLRAFVHAGHTGVTLFFVLSAFLLARPFLREAAGGARVVRSQFYARRALRILPLYWTAVLVASVLCARTPTDALRGLPYLFFLNSFAGLSSTLAPYDAVWWSLATEVQFYLVLPLLPLVLRTRLGRWLGCMLALAWLAFYGALLGAKMHTQGDILLRLSLLGRAYLFVFGIVAAWLYERYSVTARLQWMQRRWLRAGGADVAFFGTVLLLGYLLREAACRGYWTVELHSHFWHVPEGLLWTAILLLLLLTPVRAKRVVSNGVFTVIGRLSYSIYIVHIPLIYAIMRMLYPGQSYAFTGWELRSVGAVFLISLVSVGVSALTYATIERPFLMRKDRLG
jgi:peptidoglycan/LPS O-acetylase OafA/YrhL